MQPKINQRRAKNGRGGGGEDFSGDHLIFGRTKGGIAENFGRFRAGTTQICLENESIGGIAKVIKGEHFSEVTFQGGGGGSAKFHLV